MASGFHLRSSRTSTTGLAPRCGTEMDRRHHQRFGTAVGLSEDEGSRGSDEAALIRRCLRYSPISIAAVVSPAAPLSGAAVSASPRNKPPAPRPRDCSSSLYEQPGTCPRLAGQTALKAGRANHRKVNSQRAMQAARWTLLILATTLSDLAAVCLGQCSRRAAKATADVENM